jgi:hypothetical protein
MSNETMNPSMEMPDYSYPPDPKKNDKGWKNITIQCEPLIKELITKAAELLGEPTKSANMPVRVTELGKELRTCFHNGIAYIRVQSGVGSDEPVLKRQIAHEIVHVLSKRDVRNTVLEEGLCTYFAVNYGGEHAPHAHDPKEQKYYDAYVAVTELLKICPKVIKQLREPARSIDKISADEIRKLCPDCSDELATRLVSKF